MAESDKLALSSAVSEDQPDGVRAPGEISIQEFAQRAMDLQGYLIVWRTKPIGVGEVIREPIFTDSEELEHYGLVVQSTASFEDAERQWIMVTGCDFPYGGKPWPYYYKVVAE